MGKRLGLEKYTKTLEQAIKEGKEFDWQKEMLTLITYIRKIKNQARIAQLEYSKALAKYEKAVHKNCQVLRYGRTRMV